MARVVRRALKTGPRFDKCLSRVAPIDIALACLETSGVIDISRDAMVRNLIARPKTIDIASKRPVGNASILTDAISSEARIRVENDGSADTPGVTRFVPIAMNRLPLSEVFLLPF